MTQFLNLWLGDLVDSFLGLNDIASFVKVYHDKMRTRKVPIFLKFLSWNNNTCTLKF